MNEIHIKIGSDDLPPSGCEGAIHIELGGTA